VIKNPGVKRDSPYLHATLQKGGRIATDISLFLDALHLRGIAPRLFAVTGSKGKSSTVSALRFVLDEARKTGTGPMLAGRTHLGGNITVSPLSFLDETGPNDDVVLELSSWQLGDLLFSADAGTVLKPRCAIITSIMPDHQDWYHSMEGYVNDKRVIYRWQDAADATIARDDEWGRSFLAESKGRSLHCADRPLPEGTTGGWIDGMGYARLNGGSPVPIVPARPCVPGSHQKQNLLAAGLALLDTGLPAPFIYDALGRFPGLEHRLEFFRENDDIRWYNDSAATIPEAVLAAVQALRETSGKAPVLVTGGTDKGLDYRPLVEAAGQAKTVILLDGTGSEKLRPMLETTGVAYLGPFEHLDTAVSTARNAAQPGDAVVLSPGCTSFGMFLNEFDRGRKWKAAVERLA
jgi:UDP-N-acetylmuramoylalanine--D-glutamate ligase